MSYEPNTWVNGDIITATKLNNIESGVQSVSSSYTPTTWANGDIITAEKLNNIEQGIANAGGSSDNGLIVYDGEGVLNKTWQEIHDAFHNVGDVLIYYYNEGISVGAFVVGSVASNDNTYTISVYQNNVLGIAYFADSPSDYPYED